MAWWQQLWEIIARPSSEIHEPSARQQASLFSGLLFLVIFALSLAMIVWAFASPLLTMPQFVSILLTLVCYLFFYALSRSRFYRWSARAFIWIAFCGSFYTFLYLDISVPERPLAYLSLCILVAGLTLSLRETIATLFLIEAALIGVLWFFGDKTYAIFHTPFLVGMVGLLTMLSVTVNNFYRRLASEGEARYRELMNANSEGILIISDADAKILDANPASENILGYSVQEIIGRYPLEFIAPAAKDLIRETWKKRHQGVPIETEIIHKDGAIIGVEAILKPYNYLNKSAFVLTFLDISERKQVEALVVESEKRFRAIFNETTHFMGVLDTSGRIIEINEPAYEFFGIEAAIGKYFWDFPQWAHDEAARLRVQAVIKRAAKAEFIRYDVEVRDAKGLPAYLDFSLKPILDIHGQVSLLIADSRDISAYKLAEQKRIEYERRYEALFKHTADAVFIIDLEAKIITVNGRAISMLGCALSEMQGVDIATFTAPEDHSEMNHFERLRLGGEVPPVYECKMRRKNGEIFAAEISAMLVRDADNKPMYIQSMVRDLSERKRMEQQRFEMALEKERTRLLAQFIEQASHHFRTPITNIKTSLYLLPRFLDNSQKREAHMLVVNQELERLQRLLDDLLTVLRLQKSNTEFTWSQININHLLNEVRTIQEGRSYYPNYQWHWDYKTPDDTLILGDKGILGTALLNLLKNAVTYTAEMGEIRVRSYCSGAWLAIDVIDTGSGILSEDLPHIFEDFYRSQAALAADTTSSGLGLTITKSIVERHQGAIRVKSTVGEGSHFQILLPIIKDWKNPPAKPEGMLEEV